MIARVASIYICLVGLRFVYLGHLSAPGWGRLGSVACELKAHAILAVGGTYWNQR